MCVSGLNKLYVFCLAVIKMEGGTENDLRILEQQPLDEEEERERLLSGGPPSENQKRDGENRGAESERKPSTEKENKEVSLIRTSYTGEKNRRLPTSAVTGTSRGF